MTSNLPFIIIRSVWCKEWLTLLLILSSAAYIETIKKGIHHLTEPCSFYCLRRSTFPQYCSHQCTKDLCSEVHSHHRMRSEVDEVILIAAITHCQCLCKTIVIYAATGYNSHCSTCNVYKNQIQSVTNSFWLSLSNVGHQKRNTGTDEARID